MAAPGRHTVSNARTNSARRSERAATGRLLRLFTFVILIVVAFVAGFMLRSQTALVASWGIPLSEAEESALANSATQNDYETISGRVGAVERILSTYSMDGIDLNAATYTMLDDMLKSTGDPYATYYNPDLYNNYIKETTEHSYAGIGVMFADYNGRAYVSDVFEGSEAEAKGVQQGDFIESIDGEDTSEWSMTEVVSALSKGEGESVSVTWMHPSSLDAQTGESFSTTLECKVYEEANLTTELKGKVGVIKLRQITQNAADLTLEAVQSLTEQGATSFVLDLRDNPGGYLTQAVDVASLFIASGVVVEVETIDGTTTKNANNTRSADGVSTTIDAPLVVLVNAYTASAAEVLAAALQDNQRAEVVGQTTIGKGSVQVVRELDFGGAVRYTAAYYLTPLGHDIEGVGVVPEVSVANDSDKKKGTDSQMLAALDLVKKEKA